MGAWISALHDLVRAQARTRSLGCDFLCPWPRIRGLLTILSQNRRAALPQRGSPAWCAGHRGTGWLIKQRISQLERTNPTPPCTDRETGREGARACSRAFWETRSSLDSTWAPAYGGLFPKGKSGTNLATEEMWGGGYRDSVSGLPSLYQKDGKEKLRIRKRPHSQELTQRPAPWL